MRKSMFFALVAVSVAAACSDNPIDPARSPDLSAAQSDTVAPLYQMEHPNRIPGEFMVRFRPEVVDAERLARQLAAAHGGTVFSAWNGMKGFWGTLPEPAIQALRRRPEVQYIEASVRIAPSGTTTQDVRYGNWGLDRIDQRSLPLDGWYRYKNDGSGVRIWIIDTGVNGSEGDLYGRIDPNYYVTYNGTDPFAPCFDHGTPVAIMAAGRTYGVAKNATINVARVSDDCVDGDMSSGAIVNALNFIADYSPRPAVANGSFGSECGFWGCGSSVDDAVRYAVSRGVTVVVSAGNDGKDACDYSPARVSEAITVGASDRYDARAVVGGSDPWASNYGSCLDLFAPGLGLDAGYRGFSGTSSAAPLVAGTAALFLQRYPNASPGGVASEIQTAVTQGALSNIGSGSPNRLLYTLFPVRVTVQGSDATILGATEEYYADVVNGDGPSTYQWSVYWQDTGVWETLGTGQSQSIYVDGTSPRFFDVHVSVENDGSFVGGSKTVYATY